MVGKLNPDPGSRKLKLVTLNKISLDYRNKEVTLQGGNMATQNTAGKTATKNEIGMKGVSDIRCLVNQHIVNINKKNGTHVDLYTDREIYDYLNKKQVKVVAYQLAVIHEDLVQRAINAQLVAYVTTTHASEKQQQEPSNIEQQSAAMVETAKKAESNTQRAINRVLAEQSREEESTTDSSNSTNEKEVK